MDCDQTAYCGRWLAVKPIKYKTIKPNATLKSSNNSSNKIGNETNPTKVSTKPRKPRPKPSRTAMKPRKPSPQISVKQRDIKRKRGECNVLNEQNEYHVNKRHKTNSSSIPPLQPM